MRNNQVISSRYFGLFVVSFSLVVCIFEADLLLPLAKGFDGSILLMIK